MTADETTLRATALKHLENGQVEDACQMFEQIMGVGTGSAQVLSEAGYVYWLLGRVSDAEQCFFRALDIDPRHENALVNMVEMHLRAGRLVEADQYLDCLLEHYPDHATSRIANARKQFAAGDQAPGLLTITDVVERWRGDISIQLAAARLLLEYRHYVEAVSLAERNILHSAQHADFFEIWGKGLIELRRYEEADAVFTSMRRSFPRNVAPLCGLATVRIVLGDFRSAQVLLEQALEQHPEDAEAIRLYFLTLMALGDWDKLVGASRPYLEREGILIRPLVFHLIALGKLGRHDEAGEVVRYKLGQARGDHAVVRKMTERIAEEVSDLVSGSNLDMKSLLTGDSGKKS